MSNVSIYTQPTFLAAMVESCHDAIITYDHDGLITSWNASAVNLFGYRKEEAIGQFMPQLFPGYDREMGQGLDQLLDQQFDQQLMDPIEILRRHKHGHFVRVSISLSLIVDPTNTVMGISEIIRVVPPPPPCSSADERTLQYLEALFYQSPIMMCLFDAEGRYLKVNPAFADHLNRPIADIVGRTFADFLPESVVNVFHSRIRRLRETRHPLEVEDEMWINGQSCLFHTVLFPASPDNEAGFWAIATDITAHNQAIEALRESEAETRTILTTIPDLMYLIGSDGIYRRIVQSNPSLDILGHIDNPVGLCFTDVLPPEIAKHQQMAIEQALKTGALQIYEQELRLNGRHHYEEVRIAKSKDDEVLLMVRDISDRKQLEANLRQQEAQTRSILEAIPDLIFRVSADGVYREVLSPHHTFCLVPEDFIWVGKTMQEVMPAAIAYKKLHYLQRALTTGELQCYEHQLNLNGRIQYEEIRVVPIGTDEVLFLIRDISDRKQTDQELQHLQYALQQSQQQLQDVLDSAFAGIIRLRFYADLSIAYDYISPHCEQNFGYTVEELMSDVNLWRSRIHPDDWQNVLLPEFDRILGHHANSSHTFEYRFYHQNGHICWFLANCLVQWHESEQCWFITVVDTDITDRKQTEANLAQSEAQIRSILSAIPDLLYVVGADGTYRRLIQANPDIDALIHIENPVGMFIHDILPTDVANRHMAAIERTLATGDLQVYEQQITIDDRVQDEEVRLIKSGVDEVLLMVRDIGDRKQLENELKHSEAQNRAMLTAIPDLIYRVSRNGIYLSYFGDSAVVNLFPALNPIGYHLLDYFAESIVDFSTFLRIRNQQLIVMAEATTTGTLQVYEQTFEAQGETIWEEVRVIPCGSDEVLFVIRDITDRKQAEQERLLAQERLRDAQRLAKLGNWEVNHQTHTLFWSDEVFRIFEQNPKQFTPCYDGFLACIHPDDRDRVHTGYQNHVRDRTSHHIVYRLLLGNGHIKYIDEQCETIYAADGTPLRTQGTTQDITERKQTELALQNLIEATAATTGSNFFPALVSHISQALQVPYAIVTQKVGDQLEVLAFNAHGTLQAPFAYSIPGTPCEQALQCGECLIPALVQQLFPHDQDLVDLEAESYLGVALMDNHGSPIGNLCVVDTKPMINAQQKGQILRVFAARAAAELERQRATQRLEQLNQELEEKIETRTAALRASEAQIRSMIEAIPDLLLRVRRDGTCLEYVHSGHMISNAFVPIHRHLAEALPPELLLQQLEAIDRALDTQKLQVYEHQFSKGDRIAYEEVRICAISAHEALLIVRDISDRKQAEVTLRKSEATNRALIEAIPDFMVRMTSEGIQLNVINTGAIHCLTPGSSVSDINGASIFDILPTDIAQERIRLTQRALQNGRVQRQEYSFVSNGHTYYEEARITPLWDNEVLVVVRDITERKQAELNLRQSEQFLQTVFDTFPLTVFWKDRNSAYLGCNQNFLKDAGLSSTADIIGKTDYDMPWADTETEDYRSQDHTVITTETARLNIIETQTRSDGRLVWIETNKLPLRDVEGNVIGVLGTYQDITERKQAAEALQEVSSRLNLALKSAGIGAWEWNIQTKTLIWDDRMYKLYDIAPDPLTNISYETWINAVYPDDRPGVDEVYCSALSGKTEYDTVFRIVCSDGSIRHIKANAMIQWDAQGTPLRMIGINYDITKQKEAAAQLQQTNVELARATRLKDEFLANMSHELRTPLNAILGMTEAFQEGIFGDINERQFKALETVERSSSHLLELINDILDVAKIESGQVILDPATVAVAPLCRSSLAFIQQQALKKQIRLEVHLSPNLPDLFIDERRIRQVLINLLNNAVKFTPVGGQIRLEASHCSAVKDGSRLSHAPYGIVRIAVTDTGIGIAPEDITKLFQPFIQIDSALNRQYAGTGLGLTLVKRLVELHDGRVEVFSEVGVGSCFAIELPCRLPKTPQIVREEPDQALPNRGESASEKQALGPSLQSKSTLILLVEDNEANIFTLSNYLVAKGYRLAIAHNGREAIAMAQAETPDLILMDVQMPEMDGLDTITQLRGYTHLAGIPIIALTALAMEGDRDRCLNAGADGYLSKPVKLKQLVSTIENLLSK